MTGDDPATSETDSAAVISGQQSFRNSKSHLCMGVNGASRSSGALIQQFACDGRVNQKWRAFGANGIQNVNSGLCLAEASSSFGAHIVQLPCDSRGTEQWFFGLFSDGSINWVSFNNNFCIGVSGGSTAPGAQLGAFTCDNGPNQHWFSQ